MEGWTDFLPMLAFLAMEVLLRLVEKIPDRPKQQAEREKLEAEEAQTWQEMEAEARKRIQDLEAALAAERADLTAARGRLARCACGEGEASE